jgi:hypothetical protein
MMSVIKKINIVLSFNTGYFAGPNRDSGLYKDGDRRFNQLIYAPFKGFIHHKFIVFSITDFVYEKLDTGIGESCIININFSCIFHY